MGHTVHGVDYKDSWLKSNKVDLNIWLEVGQPIQLFAYAKQNWLIPNPEWWRPHWRPSRFDRVLCKSHDALRIFSGLNKNCHYVGFMSVDRFVDVPKKREFLHVAGKSQFKNTRAVVEAWQSGRIPHQLTLVSSSPAKGPGITYKNYVTESELSVLYSSHMFHLCPSEYEGWGHYIHEGRSAGGLVLLTDSPPMRDFAGPGFMIDSSFDRRHLLGDMYKVSAEDIIEVVNHVGGMPIDWLDMLSSSARAAYKEEVLNFRVRLAEQLDTLQ